MLYKIVKIEEKCGKIPIRPFSDPASIISLCRCTLENPMPLLAYCVLQLTNSYFQRVTLLI
ncbi:hypothetical protein [Escherichia coli]|uniref:hypothetical protein n=1 Tax=Escherichia coli TaxID=562 RepID=UPI003EB8CCAE